jgi:ATP/maltotriose-dependent transcriptional regulator MalT
MHQATGRSLPVEAVAVLSQRTEGWIAGLQLAALLLKGRGEIADFIRAFAGSHRYVLDYLSEEVLRRQPEAVQAFLLQTAILDRLCGPLCDAVTGVPSGQAMLEYLEQANLFLVPLDDERNWYRYHHLFHEVLRHRLRRSSPEQVPELHLRAADWYEQKGLLSEAIHHALAAPEYPQAVRLMERAATLWMLYHERSTLKWWIEALPKEHLMGSPRLCLTYAMLLVALAQSEVVEPYLEQAELALEHLPHNEATIQMLDEVDILRAHVACHRGGLPCAIALCQRALERIPRDQVLLRSTVFLTLGTSYAFNGELAAAEQALTEALEANQAAGNLYGAIDALYHLGWQHWLAGHLHLAYSTYRRALHLVESHPEYRRALRISIIFIAMGEILREWNALDEAAEAVNQGIEYGQQSGLEKALSFGVVFLAHIRQAQGRSEEAAQLVQQREQIVQQEAAATLDGESAFLYLVRFWISQGNLDAAVQWGQHYRRIPESDRSSRALYTLEGLTLARLLLAQSRQGRPLSTEHPLEEALALLERVRERSEAEGQMLDVLEALVLQSLVWQAQGHLQEALSALQEALTLAEPEGYVRLFVDEGPPMAELLQQVVASSGASPYITSLLKALGASTPQQQEAEPAQTGASSALVDSLSEREVEVLRLLALGRSNAELAQTLVVSVSTVKTHLQHIYSKIGVTSRTQAVARAQELHLLAS